MGDFFVKVKENASFVLVCLVTVVIITLVAYAVEKIAKRRSGDTDRVLATRKVVMIGMFGAISGILYCFDFGLPVAGVLVEFVKQLVKLLLKSTSTAFVGDLANYLIGCMLVLPASIIYQFHKSKHSALIGCIVGTVIMTVFGTWFNAVYLLPTFSRLFGLPMEAILGMGAAINTAVTNLTTFVILMVAPINIIKGAGISALTMLIYKKISPIIKYGASGQQSVKASE